MKTYFTVTEAYQDLRDRNGECSVLVEGIQEMKSAIFVLPTPGKQPLWY